MSDHNKTLKETIGLIIIIITTLAFLGGGALILAGFPRMDDFELFSVLIIMFLSFVGFLFGLRLLIQYGFFNEKI